MEVNGYGQHFNCEVCLIKDIKDEKKNKLKENIKYLEDSSKNIIESVNKLKEIYEKINKSKEEIKLKISKIFTKIRNIVNEREDKLLLELDNKLENEWDDNDNKLINRINDCLNIENNIKILLILIILLENAIQKKKILNFYLKKII